MTLSWGDLAPMIPAAADAPQPRLAALALAIAGRPDLWRPRVRHDPDLRWHCRLAALGDVEVWLLGWTFAQDVAWHDHGGSAGAFAVAEGELRETFTERFSSAPLRSVRCAAGSARAFGATRIHHVTNHAAAPATSIHVYSPPLMAMRFYELAPGRMPEAVRVERIVVDGAAEEERVPPVTASARHLQGEISR